jgi:REP element-mobilizing transposase RayT
MDIEYKFDYKYNPKSNRLENYNYSDNWWYFITICTKNRQEYFGEISNWKMILNEYWKIAELEILNIPIFRENVILDEFIIMPDHIHINLFLNNEISDKKVLFDEKKMFLPNISIWEWKRDENNYFSKMSPSKNSLWNIIKLFKWHTSRNINKKGKEPYFAWQKNYYDRVIRNNNELNRIIKYISENPLKWENDKNNDRWIFM